MSSITRLQKKIPISEYPNCHAVVLLMGTILPRRRFFSSYILSNKANAYHPSMVEPLRLIRVAHRKGQTRLTWPYKNHQSYDYYIETLASRHRGHPHPGPNLLFIIVIVSPLYRNTYFPSERSCHSFRMKFFLRL